MENLRKLGKKFATLDWVDEVCVYTNKTLKGYSAGKTYETVDVVIGDVNTIEEYNGKVALIQNYITDVDKLEKEYDGYRMNLTAYADVNQQKSIVFRMRIRDKEVIGAILGCKLVEVKKTYTSLTCELKAKSG